MPIIFTIQGVHLNISSALQKGVAPNLCGGRLLPTLKPQICGVTKDSVGTPLGSCVVQLFRTSNDSFLHEMTSDVVGNYCITVPLSDYPQCYIVAYKAGSPDVAGTTLNTLVGT